MLCNRWKTLAFGALWVSALALPGCGDAGEQTGAEEVQDGGQQQAVPDAPAPLPEHLVDPPDDPRAAISKALSDGLLVPPASPNDRLRAILRTAGVAEASQVLVFSRTSLQNRLITLSNPRAIYFNDDCYIGYVPGGVIEFGDADPDPDVGSGFFALDPEMGADAEFATDHSCMNCHGGSFTRNRPGFLIRSVFPDANGHPITSAGSEIVGHHTPIERRWGGWYVTGLSGDAHHRGNQTASERDNGSARLDTALGSNITDLSGYFDTDRYLVPTSDIVALMVLEHQVIMHNLLTQGSSAVHEQTLRTRALSERLGENFDPASSDTLQLVIRANAQRIVKHLLYCKEVELESPVVGDEAFQRAFRANRIEDDQGRSLKDFDLQTHMFRYRCSYMVYSRAFEMMPDLLKDEVMLQLREVLNDQSEDPDYQHLTREERQAILQILEATGVL